MGRIVAETCGEDGSADNEHIWKFPALEIFVHHRLGRVSVPMRKPPISCVVAGGRIRPPFYILATPISVRIFFLRQFTINLHWGEPELSGSAEICNRRVSTSFGRICFGRSLWIGVIRQQPSRNDFFYGMKKQALHLLIHILDPIEDTAIFSCSHLK